MRITVNPIKLETGLRPNSAGIPYTLVLRIEAIGFPTFRLLPYRLKGSHMLLGRSWDDWFATVRTKRMDSVHNR